MNRSMVIVGIMSLSILIGSCRNGEVHQEQSIISKEEVREVLNAWAKAMLDNDPVGIDRVLHSEWLYAGSDDGATTDKATAIEGIIPGVTTLKKIELQDTLIKVYGAMAVVTGREKLLFVEKGDSSIVHLRFTDVFLKEKGSVRALRTHSSPIEIMD